MQSTEDNRMVTGAPSSTGSEIDNTRKKPRKKNSSQ
jgi:hypothetical protein